MPAEFIIGAAVGAAAIAVSPRVYRFVSRGLHLGVTGVVIAYDKVAEVAHDIAKSAREEANARKGAPAEGTNGVAAVENNGTPACEAKTPTSSV